MPALVMAVPIREDNRIVGVHGRGHDRGGHFQTDRHLENGHNGVRVSAGRARATSFRTRSSSMAEKRENLNNHPLIAEFRKRGWTTITTPFAGENGQTAIGHARSNSYGWVLALQQEEQRNVRDPERHPELRTGAAGRRPCCWRSPSHGFRPGHW
ncbi:MAG: hypothetical protein MZV70_50885 [Desulfobacterales bacterium]|nr:hypothetical protein [Desulfobacterales bacterium]